ncbi:hypothetical protein MMC20_006867 [Loxospora ochrophaea]|nr:hypothetical protein [Loxospora ochrophaea]
MYHYSVPPPGYVPYTGYTTSASTSPAPDDAYNYYVPQYKTPPVSPTSRNTTKRHSRTQSYGTPRGPAGWHSPAGFPSPTYYTTMPNYGSPPAKHDHVSSFDRVKSKARRFSTSGDGGKGNSGSGNTGTKRQPSVRSQKQHIVNDAADEANYSPRYTYIEPRTAGHQTREKYVKADPYFFYNQVPAHAERNDSQPAKSQQRPRRSSQSNKQAPTPAKPTKPAKPPPVATAADAAKHGIPAGYSIKNWDPTESPILLLGSVFDANSLGKWIYDWTVYHHGAATPMSEVAGDLWLLLIKLAGKMKRAEECLPRVRNRDSREMVGDFLESGDRLWARMKKLLKICEEFMWKVAKKEGSKGAVKMGKNSGCEFVDSIFGRDRELEKTEKLMTSIRLWNMRFDANCENILRRPSAA